MWQLGSALSPILVGQVFSRTGSLSSAMIVLVLGPVLAIVALAFIRTQRQ